MSTVDPQEQAAARFLRRFSGQAAESSETSDPEQARVARRMERAWQVAGACAELPEIQLQREQALARAQRIQKRPRWPFAAAAGVAALVIAAAWQLSPLGQRAGVHITHIGEQQVLELPDRTRMVLDAQTRVRVRFSDDARSVEIERGQAQFSVAPDVSRPFKVFAGDHTIVALGTVFNVEYVDREVNVVMLEGKVAVLPTAPMATPSIELSAGEAVHIPVTGKPTVTPQADLEAATAWRQGRVIFHGEPLTEAVRRLNRYSRVQIEADDPALAELKISGVFEIGDSRAFTNAVKAYLPVTVDDPDSDTIRLRSQETKGSY